MQRRDFLKVSGAAAGVSVFGGCATVGAPAGPKVVIVGGGYGGATAAKYIKLFAPHIDVTIVERNSEFISCPISNLVLGGSKSMADITVQYSALTAKYGIKFVRGEASAVDVEKKQVRLADGTALPFDRVILSPGIDFTYADLPGLNNAAAQAAVLHAWKAGPQTVALRKQLEAMPDGGSYVISVPTAPYRCPPGPYERVCQVASYFKAAKPKSKIIVLDANPDVTSKPGLFKKAWSEMYPGMIDYRNNSKVVDVDVKGMVAKLEVGDDVKGNVLNILPPMKAGAIADPFITANKRWCEINWLTYEAKNVPGVHLLGDALQIAPGMPKSGHMANSHGKACAAAVVALLGGETPSGAPVLNNTCYSFVSADKVIHVASVHKYDEKDKTMKTIPGSGGISSAANELEGQYAMAWAKNIWADMFA
ncbi:MAG: FCSD flavin-binding domain-containing protein [Betaproteobacteria bacterium]|nr:FCSD flavin-binding domain-containing protein [Betaproteobacteria bacterium]